MAKIFGDFHFSVSACFPGAKMSPGQHHPGDKRRNYFVIWNERVMGAA